MSWGCDAPGNMRNAPQYGVNATGNEDKGEAAQRRQSARVERGAIRRIVLRSVLAVKTQWYEGCGGLSLSILPGTRVYIQKVQDMMCQHDRNQGAQKLD